MATMKSLLVCLLVALVASMSVGSVTADTTLTGVRSISWDDYFGVNAIFQYFDESQYLAQMDAIDALGITWVRLTTHWAILEPTEGNFDLTALDAVMAEMANRKYNILCYMVGSAPWATSAPSGASNTDQYPPADFSVFAGRMAMLAKRYPQVNTWQVWNEPNIVWQPAADPVAYGSLLSATVSAIREAIPSKPMATAGFAYYSQMADRSDLMLTDMVQQGIASENIVACYHPYSEYPQGDDLTTMNFLVWATTLNSMLHAAGVTNVWATEWGWSSYPGPVEAQAIIGETGQADYTLRRLALMSAMDFQKIFLFDIGDLATWASERDQFYGLIDLSNNPKPVFTALKFFFNVTGNTLAPASPPTYTNSPGDLFSVAWTRTDGKHLWFFWSDTSTASLGLPSVTSATVYSPLNGTSTPITGSSGISLPIKPYLQVLVY